MSNILPISGSKFFIGGAVDLPTADLEIEDFEDVSPSIVWVEVKGLQNLGSKGTQSNVVSTDLIGEGFTVKQKGTANGGQMTNTFAIIPGDAGQAAIRAAAKGSNKQNYQFKQEWPDGDDTVSPAILPTTDYFIGVVASAVDQGGDANTVMAMQVTIELQRDPVQAVSA